MFSLHVDEAITLRLPTLADASALFALFEHNRAYLTEWQDWPNAIQTLQDCEAFIQRRELDFADGTRISTVIVFEGEIVGMCELTKIVRPLRKAELSYWIAEAHAGRGIVTRASQALIAHAFDTMTLNRLALQYKRVNEEHANDRSRRVAQRLGFMQEGVLRQDGMTKGQLMDMVICSLLADEWRAGQHPV